jgi:peroxiredoxin
MFLGGEVVLFRRSALILAGLLFSIALPAADAPPRMAPEFTIHLTSGKDIRLSSYRGKVVALLFVSTDCPHCAEVTSFMNSVQKQYEARGYQTLAVAFNAMAVMLVDEFIKRTGAVFPVGYSDRDPVYNFLQRSPMLRTYVPISVFIDREGRIRGQYLGDDPFMGPTDAARDNNIRSLVEKLLKEGAPAAKEPSPSKRK